MAWGKTDTRNRREEPALMGVKSPEEALNDCAKKIEEYLKAEKE